MHPEWGFPNRATPLGSAAYYSIRFSTPALRDPLALLFAWRSEMRGVLRECRDPGVARAKLQWWREELDRGLSGGGQHPLSQALSPVIREHDLPPAAFTEINLAAAVESTGHRPRDLDELDAQLGEDMGTLYRLAGTLYGLREPARLAELARLGRFAGLVYLMRDLGALRRRGQDPLPPTAGPPGSVPGQALRLLARRARGLYEQRPAAGLTPAPLAIHAAILHGLLEELEAADFAVMDQRICLPPLRKLWIGWRIHRRCQTSLHSI